MRVAHICENWGKGGIQYLIRDLCNSFEQRNVTSLVAFLYEDGRVGPASGDFWAVRPIQMNQRMRLDPVGLLRLRRELTLFLPDVVQCHSYYSALAALIISRWGLRVPIIYTVHADLLPQLQRSNVVIRRVAQCCDAVVAVSRHTAATVENFTSGVVSPMVVCDGIEFRRMALASSGRDDSRRALDLAPDTLAFLTVARLTTQKDHPTLFRALADVIRQVPNVRLLVVGTGPERQNLESLVRDLDLGEHLVFCGEISWPELGTYFAAADVFALSTRCEGFGISVVEAAYAGLPIVATALGPIVDLENAGLGISLVEPRDVQSLSNALLAMSDPGVRQEFACGNSERARTLFSIERTADEYLGIYSRLLVPASRPGALAAVSD